MTPNLRRTVAPTFEPITLDELKEQMGFGDTSEWDAQLAAKIVSARERLEELLGRGFLTQTWVLKLDHFIGVITLPRLPLASVTSITYLDSAGASQTLASSAYDVFGVGQSRPPREGYIKPAYGGMGWPSTLAKDEAVTITYVVGATDRGSVPQAIRDELLRMAAWLFDHPEADQGALQVSQDVRLEYGSEWEPVYE